MEKETKAGKAAPPQIASGQGLQSDKQTGPQRDKGPRVREVGAGLNRAPGTRPEVRIEWNLL